MFCKICPKVYHFKQVLKQHMLRAHSEKNLKCDICSYKTAVKSDLRSHKMIHGLKFKCQICHKLLSSWEAHMKYHKTKMNIQTNAAGSSKSLVKVPGKKIPTIEVEPEEIQTVAVHDNLVSNEEE